MCAETHLQNMGRFLAGITKFGIDRATVKKTIEEECKSTVELGRKAFAINLSPHALHLLYESGDASILDSNQSYGCPLTDHNPPFDFSTLGYCITHSNCVWRLELGTNTQCMKSADRIELLIQALQSHSNSSYTHNVDLIALYYDTTQCVEQLLTMPENVLQQLQELIVWGNRKNPQPLPQCMPECILTMSSLYSLSLADVTAVHRTVQAVISINTLEMLQLLNCDIDNDCVTTICQLLHTSSQLKRLDIILLSLDAIEMISTALTTNSNLVTLILQESKLNLPAMQALCSMLTNNNTITEVRLGLCHIDDDIISCLAKGLHSNNTITTLDISYNLISDRGAVCMAEMLKINSTLQKVNLSKNYIGTAGQKVLKEVQETKKHIHLIYTPQR